MKVVPTSLAAALVLLCATEAAAHGALKSASPADGATIPASPATVTLQFSETVELAFSGIKITGPAKAEVATGAASHGAGGERALEVTVPGTLVPGAYKVEWRVLSKDGHKTKGAYTFIIKP